MSQKEINIIDLYLDNLSKENEESEPISSTEILAYRTANEQAGTFVLLLGVSIDIYPNEIFIHEAIAGQKLGQLCESQCNFISKSGDKRNKFPKNQIPDIVNKFHSLNIPEHLTCFSF